MFFLYSAKQSAIYDESCRGVVDSVLEGYDGTIFAYGQTGAGKTFTMEGNLHNKKTCHWAFQTGKKVRHKPSCLATEAS